MNLIGCGDALALERCLGTLRDMLHDRHFDMSRDVGLTSELNETVHITPFAWSAATHTLLSEHLLRSSMPMLVAHTNGEAVAVVVIWKPLVGHHDLIKVVQPMLDATECTNESDLPVPSWPPQHLILLTMSPLRNTDWKELTRFKLRIEAFHQGEMEFNRTRHEYVPRHELLTNAHAVSLLRALNTSGQQCPRILVSDIIARYYGSRIGDVFRIFRHDAATGDSEITFRIVSPG